MMNFKTVDVAELLQMKKNKDLRLIDVRTAAEVERGVIPGAIHIPLHMIPFKLEELDDSIPTVFYCQSGGRSGQACGFLAAKGWKNVANLQGGIISWVASGNELSRLHSPN